MLIMSIRHKQRGNAMIEFAIIAPLLLIVSLAAFEQFGPRMDQG
jgi:Flp pilus assembly protein TadG